MDKFIRKYSVCILNKKYRNRIECKYGVVGIDDTGIIFCHIYEDRPNEYELQENEKAILNSPEFNIVGKLKVRLATPLELMSFDYIYNNVVINKHDDEFIKMAKNFKYMKAIDPETQEPTLQIENECGEKWFVDVDNMIDQQEKLGDDFSIVEFLEKFGKKF